MGTDTASSARPWWTELNAGTYDEVAALNGGLSADSTFVSASALQSRPQWLDEVDSMARLDRVLGATLPTAARGSSPGECRGR